MDSLASMLESQEEIMRLNDISHLYQAPKTYIKIYLAGYINNNVMEECIQWRKLIKDHYNNWKGNEKYPIIFFDPLNSKEYEKIKGDGCEADGIPAHAIIQRDYQCVIKSDLIIVHLDTFGQSRHPIGSYCELAWAYEHKIPIVIISSDPTYKKHPFTSYMASWIVESAEELIEKKVINYFYKGWADANY